MVLCHKCSGTFHIVAGLNGCQCISGYPRGFEREHTLESAASVQVKQELEWLSLYLSQGRPLNDLYTGTFHRLLIAMKTSPLCGHGTISWQALTDVHE